MSRRVRIIKKEIKTISDKIIPKIIHQVWIGPKKRPEKLMNTWKEKHPDFQYILWTEENLKDMKFECIDKINQIEEINGKCDIIRWEILYKYGGVFMDADSFCIEKLDDSLMKREEFFSYESEKYIPGLISTSAMGFYKCHPLVRSIIDDIKTAKISFSETRKMAWETVGPGIITRHFSKFKKSIEILPSYYFVPSWKKEPIVYKGHGKIYSKQEWGSTFQSYEKMQEKNIPDEFLEPREYYSILIPSYNSERHHILECLKSIRNQVGHFGIELVWIDDGSDEKNSIELKDILKKFIETCRFTKLKYHKIEKNKGVANALNEGIRLCTSDLIFRMDSDDLMKEDRMIKQINHMLNNKDTVWLGTAIESTEGNIYRWEDITFEQFKQNQSFWICSHPSVCFRKKQIEDLGCYDIGTEGMEDFDLELRILKRYGKISTLNEVLLTYRIHCNQVTRKRSSIPVDKLKKIIQKNIFS